MKEANLSLVNPGIPRQSLQHPPAAQWRCLHFLHAREVTSCKSRLTRAEGNPLHPFPPFFITHSHPNLLLFEMSVVGPRTLVALGSHHFQKLGKLSVFARIRLNLGTAIVVR